MNVPSKNAALGMKNLRKKRGFDIEQNKTGLKFRKIGRWYIFAHHLIQYCKSGRTRLEQLPVTTIANLSPTDVRRRKNDRDSKHLTRLPAIQLEAVRVTYIQYCTRIIMITFFCDTSFIFQQHKG